MTSTSTRAETFDRLWATPKGPRALLSVQHKTVGGRFMITAFVLFLIGGVEALFMRTQLAQPENDFLAPETYNQLFTMHGSTMMFLFVVPFLEGLASYLLPLQLGARELPFPRLNAFNYWCYLFGGLILYSSFLVDMVPDAGWFAYVPLSGPEFSDQAMDIWLFGLTLAEISAVGAAAEIITAVLRFRAPGMSLNRMPILAWSMLAVGLLIVVAFVPLIVASILLEMDRSVGTTFFDSDAGGNPLLWQHLFWIFGHPEVYVMFLPGAAIISHVVPAHSQRRLEAYPLVVLAIIATAVMSLGLWVHHMYTVGLPPVTLSFFTVASMSIALASGLQVFAWLATMWLGTVRLTVPMMYALGFIVTFVAGGVTGVMVAAAPFDGQVHDTYFVVAHFHYVLIGGVLFPIFAALFHWWPKFTGRMTSRFLGHLSFWLVFVGFHTTFFPMHLSGLWGMPRRVYTYERELGVGFLNLLSTIGAFILAAGVVVVVVALMTAWTRGRPAPEDPWEADTLEWRMPSPPPNANWNAYPVVRSRHPAWDEPDDVDRYPQVTEAFDHRPLDRRRTLTSSVLTAEPDGATHIPLPSPWPFVPAFGLAMVAVGLLLKTWLVAGPALAVVLLGVVGWVVSNETERGDDVIGPVGGVFNLEPSGPTSTTWWAGAAAAIAGAVTVVTVAFSGLYLQVNAPAWPPDGETLDRPWHSAVILVLLAVAFLAARHGGRRGFDDPDVRDADDGTLVAQRLGGWLAVGAGLAALVVLVLLWVGSDLEPKVHAYDSTALLLLGLQGLFTLGAVMLTGAGLYARHRHRRGSRTGMLLQAAGLLWVLALGSWALIWITTDLLPVVVG
ncbi:hypothetical protein GCM10023169_35680 [Georgenia halophila]|uniref:cytochrome-c oxidase n=1 Tax=Georgenia halophila TaxID=620889 RepID=A0ABP8LLY6_9MICO